MSEPCCIDYLYHYYERCIGPFVNLSDLASDEAKKILFELKSKNVFASQRDENYVDRRMELEKVARDLFISKGGKPTRLVPHYMVVGECSWLRGWYEDGESVKIHISQFEKNTISFSYGDLFPTFSPHVIDKKEYRRKIYTFEEIQEVIKKYGLPQEWNSTGKYGPERYIEVQVWSDLPLKNYIGTVVRGI